MGDLGPIKLIVGAGVILTAFLLGVGMFTNQENEKHGELVQEAKSARQQQMQMFNMALEQAREAQKLARMQMEANMAQMEGQYVNYPEDRLYGPGQ